MLYLIPAIILAIFILLAVTLAILSPGGPPPLTDGNGKVIGGSISEKIYVNINGVQQGMIIQSKNPANPVLLVLHGGMPEFFLTTDYPTGLEDIFTVVWWEQRGSGISYSPDFPREQITLDLLVSDTLAVTNYLRERFGQEKIYLMGHSGGSFIGVYAAARAPELYHAYIGTAQMANQLESERLAYEYMLEQFTATGNKKMVRLLQAVAGNPNRRHAPGLPETERSGDAHFGHWHHARHEKLYPWYIFALAGESKLHGQGKNHHLAGKIHHGCQSTMVRQYLNGFIAASAGTGASSLFP